MLNIDNIKWIIKNPSFEMKDSTPTYKFLQNLQTATTISDDYHFIKTI
ncbi:MAG: hypothetical protein Q8T08_02890 [Ignavibacteria bacterium]|nr:hypothetical protein [Ignavibacteria bacterium]